MIKLEKISKFYQVGDEQVTALQDISFPIEKGKLTIILGPSGSGKSTLLNILGGMDQPTAGKFLFEGENVTQFDDHQLTDYRRKVVGFVSQFYNLVPSLTALENVAIAARLTANDHRAEEYLAKVGLKQRLNNFPSQMSGGEMQRVSIARALSKKPEMLLCDEPTGALDTKTSLRIMKILQEVAKTSKTAVIVVTHNPSFERYGDCIVRLRDGRVESIKRNPVPSEIGEDVK
ncbi:MULTISPECIES: ABC transporter ATP-binding protein [Lactobacillus]|uniref:ABC transporter ATP-binding protein n=1 Tax=Lactobacillus TaxID=1578 RepID=UPI000CD9EC39|nr:MULTISPECIES: ABC transporter ATP-binding protein [Lactobacillus]RVU77494.1 ABC transporter ATP-binding protein [Lactobacillus xujianguonis]